MFSLNAYTLCTTKMQNDRGKKKEKVLTAPPPHSVTWYSQEPINSQDKTDVISGQSHRGQHHQHSDETSTRDTGSSYTGTRGCQAKTKKDIEANSDETNTLKNSNMKYMYDTNYFLKNLQCFSE